MDHLNVLLLGIATLAVLLVLRAVSRRRSAPGSIADDDESKRLDRPAGYGLERDAEPAKGEADTERGPLGGLGAAAAAVGGALILGVEAARLHDGSSGDDSTTPDAGDASGSDSSSDSGGGDSGGGSDD